MWNASLSSLEERCAAAGASRDAHDSLALALFSRPLALPPPRGHQPSTLTLQLEHVPFFVINLDKRVDRRTRMTSFLHGYNVTFVSAVNACNCR